MPFFLISNDDRWMYQRFLSRPLWHKRNDHASEVDRGMAMAMLNKGRSDSGRKAVKPASPFPTTTALYIFSASLTFSRWGFFLYFIPAIKWHGACADRRRPAPAILHCRYVQQRSGSYACMARYIIFAEVGICVNLVQEKMVLRYRQSFFIQAIESPTNGL